MNKFTISDLEKFSGVKSHTIRIWEKRYNALKPERTAGNTRYYSDTQLKRLINIASLVNNKLKPSVVCKYDDRQLSDQIRELINESQYTFDFYINQCIIYALDYNREGIDSIMDKIQSQTDNLQFYNEFIYPLIQTIEKFYVCNDISSANEHFISNIIKQRLSALIYNLPPVTNPHSTWLLFLPEDEYHELGLMMAQLILLSNGFDVIYMGASFPVEQAIPIINSKNINNILTFFVHSDLQENVQQLMDKIDDIFPKQSIYIGCNKHFKNQNGSHSRFHFLSSPSELISRLIKS